MTQVLVIDDDADIRDLMRMWLEREGIDAIEAGSAADGFQAFDRFDFDAIIVDIFMPGRDGLETIRAIRQQAPRLPIIVITGLAPRGAPNFVPDLLTMAMKLGASQGLRKPFAAQQLVDAVKSCTVPAR